MAFQHNGILLELATMHTHIRLKKTYTSNSKEQEHRILSIH